ncbi:mCG113012, partial [Mus musculus]
KRPAFGKHENMPPHVEADENIRDEQDSMLDKCGENVSFSVEWQRFACSVETPMENWNLLSGEQQVRNASELDLMEVQNPVTHDDGNANPEEVVGDTRKKINNKLCEQKFDMDIQKFNEEQEKSVNNYQKEQQALKLSECSQSPTLEAIEDMHEKSMEVCCT